MKTISLEISEEFDRQLRIQAALLDMNRSELIRAVLEEKSAQWDIALVPHTSTEHTCEAAIGPSDDVDSDSRLNIMA